MHGLQGLKELGVEIISTGGTASAIEKAGVPVKKVEDVTGFPEMLDGKQLAHVAGQLQPCMLWLWLQRAWHACAVLSQVACYVMPLGLGPAWTAHARRVQDADHFN